MRYLIILTATIIIVALSSSSATIINVPDDYAAIQQGIDASIIGDTVLVQPGTYVENINFNGHNIVLGSMYLTTGDTTFIDSTFIKGGFDGSVITFENGEDTCSKITGFTICEGNNMNGGGIFCTGSNPEISHNIIRNNIVSERGGGIFCGNASNPMISYNKISNNNSVLSGGGIRCTDSSPVISYNLICNNSTFPEWGCSGGAISCYNGNPVIRHNTIIWNTADFLGGGIACSYLSPMISYNLIAYNTADYGGGIYCISSFPNIINNTISRNTAIYEGGGLKDLLGANPTITNCIFWGNIAQSDSEISSLTNITYCDIQGGWEGEGNIDADPLFCNPDSGNFWLAENSPCVGAGQNGVDIGAFGIGCEATDIFDEEAILPLSLTLEQNYPNPFNASTQISYLLPEQAQVSIDIYNILGQRVVSLFDGIQPAGNHQAIWNASGQASGIYFYRIKAGDKVETKKMQLLK